jgi:hypothetical protein
VTTGTGGTFSAGSGSATATNGQAAFTINATSTPGSCVLAVTTSNTSISGTSATLTTQLVGAPNKLAVISNASPKPAATPNGTCNSTNNSAGTITDPSCIKVVVELEDVNGLRVTNSTQQVSVTATLDANTCTGAGGGAGAAPTIGTNPVSTSSGRATFYFASAGAYSACSVTFSATGITSVSTTLTWTAGGADHLTCSFSPATIINDGASTSNATVKVRDALGNTVSTGSYSVTFGKSTDNGATTLLTSNPQTTSGGSTTYTVRSNAGVTNTDTYVGHITSGSTPTLPNSPASDTGCTIATKATLP